MRPLRRGPILRCPFRGPTRLVSSAVARAPEPEVFIVSHPKSGRTWLRLLLGKALMLHYGLTEHPLDTRALTAAAGVLCTQFSHDGSALRDQFEEAHSPGRSRVYGDKKVVILMRDVRDVLVSSYFEATKRSFVFEDDPLSFEGTLSEFIRSPLGVRRVASFYDEWTRSRSIAKASMLVRYEQLHAAPGGVLRQVLQFIGAGAVTQPAISEAVEYATARNMRRLERADALDDPRLRPGDRSDPDSYKVRRAVVGGYVDYLSPGDIAYVDRVLARGFRASRPRAARSCSVDGGTSQE